MATNTQNPRTALDDLWAEMLLDACASDGPIRDNDVRQALIRYRPRIEAEARAGLGDLIERVKSMPPNGVISRWENVSRSAVIDLLLAALGRNAA